jgi:hypothetical protein
MTDNDPKQSDASDIRALGQLMDHVAAADLAVAREMLRENPTLADAVLSDAALKQSLAVVLHDLQADATTQQATIKEAPGVFTELTRTLTPEHAEALYRKITPLLVYELLRTLDRSADIGTVQRIVDRLCSRAVQDRLRSCAHVRDGILDEIAAVLCDVGLRETLDRQAVQEVMADCGVLGELSTLENCVRLMRTQAG